MSQRTNGDLRVAGENSLIVRRVLTVRDTWPIFAGERPVASSGLCCMLVLIKKIYSFASDFWNPYDEANQKREQQNAFLALAWENLSSTEPGAMTDAVNRIWGTEISRVPLSDLTFRNIVSSPTMCETLWSNRWFCPFATSYWRNNPVGASGDIQPWRKVDEDAPNVVRDFVKEKCSATPETFRFDATPEIDLNEAVEARFGCWRIGDLQIVIRKTGSCFFFATFDVKNVAQDRVLHFAQIRSFAFRVPPFAAKDDLPACPARTEVYNLAAIVFQRQQPTDVDSIRIYEPNGMPRVPIGPENICSWPSVCVSQLRNGESFFALYAINMTRPPGIDPNYPEDARDLKPATKSHSFENAKRAFYEAFG
ncbi:hypothetical protein BBO_00171 [Beauveria brongniartii RCEF 3172]|uniref:Uncharacterized protein n=1 Tax=Beauveria brongniartii RCEF 3172 TaxID=1081107 RepID=A0A162M846_9HYPO|nr:hypothetical protein BBO_00171 [Beauveria brongniartii RCEF 3172]